MTKRIAILLPDLRGGGAERVCLNLANEFANRGLQVRMVLMRAEGELLPLLDARVEVFDFGAARVRDAFWPMVRYLRKDRPAALLANMWPLTFLVVLARKLARADCRVVAVEHTTWSAAWLASKRATLGFKASMKWMQPRVDALLAVSKGAAKDLERFAGLPSGSVQVQYNPIVASASQSELAIALLPDAAWSQGNHRRILAVGTLKAVKDFPLLLQALVRVRRQTDARLLILGEGEERPALESLIRDLGLESYVELPGFVVNTAPYCARADLFVLSSDHEGFGNVIVEALDHGLPVVSTDCPSGPREILQDGEYGTLVPTGDVVAMAQAIQESLSQTHDREALQRRAQDFRVDTAADAYLDLLLPGWRQDESTARVSAT